MTSIFNVREKASPAVQAVLDEIAAGGRAMHSERFAPNGEPLINYAGQSWIARLANWYLAHPEALQK